MKRSQLDSLDIDKTILSQNQQRVVLDALKKIETGNLMLSPERPEKLNGWSIVKGGFSEFEKNYLEAPMFYSCLMNNTLQYKDLPARVQKAFEDNQAVLTAGCWFRRVGGHRDVMSYGKCSVTLSSKEGKCLSRKSCDNYLDYDWDMRYEYEKSPLAMTQEDVDDISALRNGTFALEIEAKNVRVKDIYFCIVFK